MSELNHNIRLAFRSVTENIQQVTGGLTAQIGVNPQQARLLLYVNAHEGTIQRDLAVYLRRRNPSVTSMLQGLEKNGFLERRIPKDNARQKEIYLLPKGKEAVEQLMKILKTSDKLLVKPLSKKEKEELLVLLERLNTNLKDSLTDA